MAEQHRKTSARARAGALAATGLIASSAAAAGLGAIATMPAGAATATKLYACYSDKTNALSYDPKGAKCARGETQISWNAAGPQGAKGAQGAQGGSGAQGAKGSQGANGAQGAQGAAGAQGGGGAQGFQGAQGARGLQGAQGAQGGSGAQGAKGAQGAAGPQGPPGAVSAYSDHHSFGAFTTRLSSKPGVVAAVFPAVSTYFTVNADVTISAYAPTWARCRVEAVSRHGSVRSTTPWAEDLQQGSVDQFRMGVIGVTGAVFAGHSRDSSSSDTIEVVCEASGSPKTSAWVNNVAMTATRASSLNAAIPAARPANKFSKSAKRSHA
ncbi:MAG: hypothetical protein ACLQK4_08520 [Acidimicrobiales bacterium]|jgi:hypothetical protein